jgi:hypothetical protein
MDTIMETLTTTDAAVAAGVSLPEINRVIDDKILPEGWYSTSPVRSFRTDACLFIAFYYETADWLTASARVQTIRDAATHRSSWENWQDYVAADHFLTVRFSDLWKTVDRRLKQLASAERMVVGNSRASSWKMIGPLSHAIVLTFAVQLTRPAPQVSMPMSLRRGIDLHQRTRAHDGADRSSIIRLGIELHGTMQTLNEVMRSPWPRTGISTKSRGTRCHSEPQLTLWLLEEGRAGIACRFPSSISTCQINFSCLIRAPQFARQSVKSTKERRIVAESSYSTCKTE